MHRRNFLKKALGGAMALAVVKMPEFAFAQSPPGLRVPGKSDVNSPAFSKLRGVNLGGWLVLEKWMVPEVYDGTEAQDEYSFSLGLGNQAESRLDRHRETFITAADFRWIRTGLECRPFAGRLLGAGSAETLCRMFPVIDFALDQCQRNGLKLLLDLHGAPGSQNGWDHSGRSGPINWHKDPQNIRRP